MNCEWSNRGANWIIAVSKDKKKILLKISWKLVRRAIHTANTAYSCAFLYFTLFLCVHWMTFVCQWLVRITATLQQCSHADNHRHLALFRMRMCVWCISTANDETIPFIFVFMNHERCTSQLVVVSENAWKWFGVWVSVVWYASYSIKCT